MFWGLEFETPDYVLSPYRETEALIEKILTILCPYVDYRIADLGTGSGCIAIAIAKERPDCTIIATDINQDIVDVAQAHGVNRWGNSSFKSEQAKAIMIDSGFTNVKSLADISGDLRFTMGRKCGSC